MQTVCIVHGRQAQHGAAMSIDCLDLPVTALDQSRILHTGVRKLE